MNPLNIQNTSQGTVVTYKLGPGEKLDRMTMGMLRNNHIQGLVPIQYSQVDAERWIKYEVHAMIPLQAYLSGGLNRKKALTLFNQVVDTFILAEDYMIDAAFIILNPNYVFVNAFTGKIGIICLPVTGFVGDVTLREFLIRITGRGQFDPNENCDYVMKIRNFVSGAGFSIPQLKKMLEELTGESVQRSYREESVDSKDTYAEAGGQIAVTVESVGQVVNQGTTAVNGIGVGKPVYSGDLYGKKNQGSESGQQEPELEQRTKEKRGKEKKGLFGRKKKKKEKKTVNESVSIPGMEIPGMDIPGVDMSQQTETSASSVAGTVVRGEKMLPAAENSESGVELGNTLPVRDSLSGISDLIIGKSEASHSVNKPEWKVSSDYEGVAISDATVYLNANRNGSPAVLKRIRTGETVTIEKEELVLGKDVNSVDYCVSGNSTVSRVHARIIKRNNQYFVIDHNSMNHTYVNNMQITAGIEIPLQSGCSIRLSDEEFQFVNGEEV